MIDPINPNAEIGHDVVETIIALAVREVPGVASVGNPPAHVLQAVLHGTPSNQGIELIQNEQGALTVGVHVDVKYGVALGDVAADIRQAVADAVTSQTSMSVDSVDVYIDGIRFKD